jgi:hypothetical protein
MLLLVPPLGFTTIETIKVVYSVYLGTLNEGIRYRNTPLKLPWASTTLKNKVFKVKLVILVHDKKNFLYATLNPLLGVETRSKKINRHHIIRQNWMENPKKNNRFAHRELLFLTKCGS